jgi:hypothetical protein
MLSAAMTALLLVHVACVVLHVATAAAWFGVTMRLTGEVRAIASADPSLAGGMAASTASAVRQLGMFLLLTLVFALGAVFTNGGFETYSWAYWWQVHVSLGLMIALIGVHYLVVVPSWRALVQAAGTPEAMSRRARLSAVFGIGHLVWLTILILMFYPRFTAALSVG